MHNLMSRRRFVGSAAAVAAISTTTLALAGESDDARLIELGRQFDELAARDNAAGEEARALWEPMCDLMRARGFPPPDTEALRAAYPDGLNDHYNEWAAAWIKAAKDSGQEAAAARSSAASEALGPVARAIHVIPARTMNGLAVKARVARHYSPADPFSIADEELDWDVLCLVAVAENVLTLAEGNIASA